MEDLETLYIISRILKIYVFLFQGGGSKTQEHLGQLFKALESYYHPSNSGIWCRSLHDFLNKLTLLFIRRLHRLV